ncbi:hypothetical protein Taro_037536 [Colocasia esculenta]|uniref:Uncharacterized protein n=1 Tax=Colocasia esculenta TaxID=4460 RepID=A0A843W4E6_COLES|nr:hypothetical protein [Colocasia esculenta]
MRVATGSTEIATGLRLEELGEELERSFLSTNSPPLVLSSWSRNLLARGAEAGARLASRACGLRVPLLAASGGGLVAVVTRASGGSRFRVLSVPWSHSWVPARDGIGVCSFLTWRCVWGPGWFCLWALDLVEFLLLWPVRDCVGGRRVKVGNATRRPIAFWGPEAKSLCWFPPFPLSLLSLFPPFFEVERSSSRPSLVLELGGAGGGSWWSGGAARSEEEAAEVS